MFTVRIFTNPDQTLWEDHTFPSAAEAQKAVNHVGEGEPLNPAALDQQWGFRIYDERGICFHSDSGEGIGESK